LSIKKWFTGLLTAISEQNSQLDTISNHPTIKQQSRVHYCKALSNCLTGARAFSKAQLATQLKWRDTVETIVKQQTDNSLTDIWNVTGYDITILSGVARI